MFDLSSVSGFGFITCYIGLVDSNPSRGRRLRSGDDVEGSNQVCVVLESAIYASEKRLGSPVCPVNVSASRTGFGGVPGIHVDYGYPSLEGFVLDEGLELCESPAVEIAVLAFPVFCPVTDSRQFLHNNHIAFFEAVHKLSAGLVQNRVSPVSLLSPQPFQAAFSRFRALGLEGRTEPSKMLPLFEDGFSFNLEAVGSDKKIIHSNVYTNGITPSGFGNCSSDCNVEEEVFIIVIVLVDQNCVCWFSILKKLPLVFANAERWFHSFLNSGNRSVYSVRLVDKSEEPFIQIHGKLREFEKLPFLVLPIGFSNAVSSPDGEIRGEIKLLPCFSVNNMMECNRVEHSLFKGYPRNVITSVSKSLEGVKQFLILNNSRVKFTDNSFRKLHKKIYIFSIFKYPKFLPPLKREWVS